MQIAIDGPAGAGKSTVAKALASRLHCKYLDSGALFRAIGYELMRQGVDVNNEADVDKYLPDIHIGVEYDGPIQHVLVNGEDVTDRIRTQEVGRAASDVGKWSAVRSMLMTIERDFASKNDVIMDGRDIASVILPNADYKFFVTATAAARAQRRVKDLQAAGIEANAQDVEKEIRARDDQDMHRAIAPLRQVEGQTLIDTSELTQDEVVDKLQRMIEGRT